MAGCRREGLRVLLPAHVVNREEEKKKQNAERSRKYRENQKKDADSFSVYREYNKQKCKEYRKRPLTEEQLQSRREAGRLRAKKYRDAQKKKNGPVTSTPKTPRQRPKTRHAVEEERELWRLQKQAQRRKWTSQKWRRHREKCARYNKEKRDKARMVNVLSTPLPPHPDSMKASSEAVHVKESPEV